MMKQSNIFAKIGLMVGIVVLLNLISYRFFVRLDFTADQRYTLSKATKDVLNEAEQHVITVSAYFSEDLPPQLMATKRDFEDLLIEYERRSGANVVYKFNNPNVSEEEERKAQEAGIMPVLVSVQDRDQMKQIRAYMGAVIEVADRKEILPVIQPGAAMEYALTTAIKKLIVTEKPKVAFLQGHGEEPMEHSGGVLDELSVLYDAEPYSISPTEEIPSTYRTLVIVHPKDSFPDAHLEKLDNFLRNGGGVYLAYSHVAGNLQTRMVDRSYVGGLEQWLADKGVHFEEKVVTDVSSASVNVQQVQGPFVFTSSVQFPYFPMISHFADHPISKGLEAMMFQFTAPIRLDTDSTVESIPLAATSQRSGMEQIPLSFDIDRQWREDDFKEGSLPVAVALSGKLAGERPSRLVVVGNGMVASTPDSSPESRQTLPPDNVSFTVNAIDWLSDDTGLISLRTKGVSARPLAVLEDGTKELIRYLNLLGPVLLILLYAAYRRHQMGKKRERWIEGDYR